MVIELTNWTGYMWEFEHKESGVTLKFFATDLKEAQRKIRIMFGSYEGEIDFNLEGWDIE